MTRDPEMLERAKHYRDARFHMHPWRNQDAADFARAELVRELEALREARLHRVVQTDKWSQGWNEAIDHVKRGIDARLTALRGATDNGPGRGERERLADESRAGNEAAAPARPAEQVVGGSREGGPGSDAHADSQVRPSSALSDADVLDRAAEILESAEPDTFTTAWMRQRAARLRAPEPDWADRLADASFAVPAGTPYVHHLAATLRERVGPLVEAARAWRDLKSIGAALAKLEGGAE